MRTTDTELARFEVGGTQLAVRLAGDRGKPALLLIHGLPNSSGYFRNVIGPLKTVERILRLARWTPILFIPVQVAGWLISAYLQRLSDPDLVGIWEPLPAFAAYVLIFGYGYVALVALA